MLPSSFIEVVVPCVDVFATCDSGLVIEGHDAFRNVYEREKLRRLLRKPRGGHEILARKSTSSKSSLRFVVVLGYARASRKMTKHSLLNVSSTKAAFPQYLSQ